MVFIHLKSAVVGGDNTNASANNNDGFLYETTTSTKVDDLINSLVEVHNARLCSCLVADAVKGLAMYGVMKQPSSCVGDDDEVRINYTFLLQLHYKISSSAKQSTNFQHSYIYNAGNKT